VTAYTSVSRYTLLASLQLRLPEIAEDRLLIRRKISTRRRTLRLKKPLVGSTTTRSNVQSNTNVEPVGAASGATVQT
jgi:lipase chaperone LimK